MNTNSITGGIRNGSVYSTNTLNNNSIINENNGTSTSLKYGNGSTKPLLGRHLSLADRSGSYSNDNLIVEKRSRFELSHQTPTTSTSEIKQSRFIVTEGNNGKKKK